MGYRCQQSIAQGSELPLWKDLNSVWIALLHFKSGWLHLLLSWPSSMSSPSLGYSLWLAPNEYLPQLVDSDRLALFVLRSVHWVGFLLRWADRSNSQRCRLFWTPLKCSLSLSLALKPRFTQRECRLRRWGRQIERAICLLSPTCWLRQASILISWQTLFNFFHRTGQTIPAEPLL